MADTKITALTALTAADPANDVIPIVDVSDTSMAASGTTKKISVNNILGASGTATLASATITGDLTVRTNKLLVTATGVGVGAAPVNPFDVTSTSGTLSVFKRTGSNGAFIGIEDGSGAGLAYLGVTNGTFSIQTPGSGYSDKLSVDTSGNVSISTGNLVMATSGKGIDFSATANSSGTMTSELLNDYEEGTWVGTLKGSVSDPTVAVTATGKYTKVGRQVTVSIYYNNVSTVGASGNVTIDGLPFTGSESFAGSSITFGLFTTSTTLACWNVSTSIAFYITGNFVQATHSPGTGKYLTTTITYFV